MKICYFCLTHSVKEWNINSLLICLSICHKMEKISKNLFKNLPVNEWQSFDFKSFKDEEVCDV